MAELPEHTVSSGNVFADMGLPDAEELLAKADLAIQISRIIEESDLTQAKAAELLGIDQPKVSALVRGRLEGFSIERLTRFLNALGQDVEIRGAAEAAYPAARPDAGDHTAPQRPGNGRSARRLKSRLELHKARLRGLHPLLGTGLQSA